MHRNSIKGQRGVGRSVSGGGKRGLVGSCEGCEAQLDASLEGRRQAESSDAAFV